MDYEFMFSFDPLLIPFKPLQKSGLCALCGFDKSEGEHMKWYDNGDDAPSWGCRNLLEVHHPKSCGVITGIGE